MIGVSHVALPKELIILCLKKAKRVFGVPHRIRCLREITPKHSKFPSGLTASAKRLDMPKAPLNG